MKRSIKKATPKRRGRPATGKDPTRTFRLSDEFIAAVDVWAAGQGDSPSRSEAIRRLVELGLTVRSKTRPTGRLRAAVVADLAAEAIDSLGPKVKTKAKQPSAARAVRAKELATKAIEKIIDPAAPPEERALRRRRITKGPSEFREDRVDLPAKGK
jgi:Arc/MetJ-type ribon-helix-helix transcriptional regulator